MDLRHAHFNHAAHLYGLRPSQLAAAMLTVGAKEVGHV